MKNQKTEQEKEGDNLLVWLAKQILTGVFKVRSGTVTDEMTNKGGKRIIFFIQENKDDK